LASEMRQSVRDLALFELDSTETTHKEKHNSEEDLPQPTT
jgi:hypothetical protein